MRWGKEEKGSRGRERMREDWERQEDREKQTGINKSRERKRGDRQE